MDKKYLVIGQDYNNGGIFAIFISVLSYIIWAKRNNYIPIVDLKHNFTQYFKEKRTYLDNVWEYFFNQPSQIGVDDIKDGMDIKISGTSFFSDESCALRPCDIPTTKDKISSNPNARDYMELTSFNNELKTELDNRYNQIIGDKSEILGILCRGTDYLAKRPTGHNIQPKISEVIKKTKELIKSKPIKYIWLATEDAKVYKMFTDEFGEMIIPNNQYKYEDTKNNYLYEVSPKQENHAYNLCKDYMLSMYILSKCKYLIGGKTYGTLGVYLLSGLFKNQEYVYFWDLGRYGLLHYNNFLEKIFSIKYSKSDKMDMLYITLFGMKSSLRLRHSGEHRRK